MDSRELLSVLRRESYFFGFDHLHKIERGFMSGKISYYVYLILMSQETYNFSTNPKKYFKSKNKDFIPCECPIFTP